MPRSAALGAWPCSRIPYTLADVDRPAIHAAPCSLCSPLPSPALTAADGPHESHESSQMSLSAHGCGPGLRPRCVWVITQVPWGTFGPISSAPHAADRPEPIGAPKIPVQGRREAGLGPAVQVRNAPEMPRQPRPHAGIGHMLVKLLQTRSIHSTGHVSPFHTSTGHNTCRQTHRFEHNTMLLTRHYV